MSDVCTVAGVVEFPGYEILKALGEGRMGTVYLARQLNIGRTVALKVIRPDRLEFGSPERRAELFSRFQSETQAAARLEHESIVPVYEIGQFGERSYFSMRYIEGQTLDERLRTGPLDGQAAAELLIPVARAVQHAHDHGVLHRDLKPRNVLIDAGGHPFVTDFGLARSLDDDSHLTHTGEILGTPSYMSPEQARGEADLGPAADIYSLGATLYELITGRPPFRAASIAETLRQVMQDEPISPRRLNPAIARDLETICLKCLEKDPLRRYEHAADLAHELQRFQRGEPIMSRPISFTTRAAGWCRRNPQQASLALTVAVVLVLGTVVSSALESRRAAIRFRRLGQRRANLGCLAGVRHRRRIHSRRSLAGCLGTRSRRRTQRDHRSVP